MKENLGLRILILILAILLSRHANAGYIYFSNVAPAYSGSTIFFQNNNVGEKTIKIWTMENEKIKVIYSGEVTSITIPEDQEYTKSKDEDPAPSIPIIKEKGLRHIKFVSENEVVQIFFDLTLSKVPMQKNAFKNTGKNEAEKRLFEAANNLKTSDILVTDTFGKPANAWSLVASFVTDLSQSKPIVSNEGDGTDASLKKIFRSLVKKEVGSARILGLPGTGKTFLLKKMIEILKSGKGPRSLEDSVFLQIDPAALGAGTGYRGSVESRVSAMIALSKAYKIVWVIDEIHTLRGSGTHSGNLNDIFNDLKPGLTEGYIRLIGMTTPHEWSAAFAGDPALDERFGEIKLAEPAGELLKSALAGFIKKHAFPEIGTEEMELLIRYSSEFNAEGAQPRKATLLIEEVFAEQNLSGNLQSPTIEEIKKAAQSLYSLDPDQFERSKQIEKWKNSNRVLSQEIVGQINAKLAVTNSYGMTISGMEDKTKPKSRKIFAGPPGQGKTELIYAAGKVMGVPVVRIVMTSYTSPTQTQDLKKTITEALRRNALSLLFFDEIEKAHPSVQKDLLDILDSGTFAVSEPTANGRGSVTRVINVKNSHVFMATNAGTSYIDSLALESEYDAKKMRQTMIEDGLSEYVIDRMDGIVPFFYLSIDEYRSVVIKKIRKIVEEFKLSNPKIKLKLNNLKGFVDQFVTQTFHAKMSNREALMALSENLRSSISNEANSHAILEKVEISLEGTRKIKFDSCKAIFSE